MWKPHYGVCSNCQKQSLIVVKKLLCKKCNNAHKQINNPKKTDSGKGYSVKPTNTLLPCRTRFNSSSMGLLSGIKKTNSQKQKKKKPIQYSKKRTGEKSTFIEIWSERPHICQVCEKGLGDEPIVHFFSHVISKGAYPKFRLDKRNIWLCCYDCHYQYGNGDKNDPKFAEKNKLAELLKIEYNTK